jgi:DNA polymerase III subunit epsilon
MGALGWHALGDLPDAVDDVVTTLRLTRRESRKAAEAEAARVDEQRTWLEAILQGLSEGILVCNRQHRIMLYNVAATSLVDAPDRVGLGRSIGEVLSLPPLRHSLTRLENRRGEAEEPEISAPFVCTTIDGTRVLHGRMALLCDRAGAVSGYLVTLTDISGELALLAKGDAVRRALTRDLRGMVGNLRAAAETMAAFPEMPAEDRARFEAVILEESESITETLDRLGQEIRGHMLGRWPMADIYVSDLVRSLDSVLEGSGLKLTLVGLPLWVHGDSLSLIHVLEALMRRIAEAHDVTSFDLEPMLGDRRVYLDLVWSGEPVAAGDLEVWLDAAAGVEAGAQRLRDVLERHGSEPWSMRGTREGTAVLRLPLIAPNRQQFEPEARRLPARPEFYDFGLMKAHLGDSALASRPMRALDFVVFDCEMTGLQPMQGDEIIQIGAVRIVQGRILTGESFERLVNPGRPIPPASIKFHGLTDADVAGKPPLREVLPEFAAYVDDAVMVGHNAAFDMKFLTLRQHEAGVDFDNPVLDTMLISKMLDEEDDDHSLDALCDRYGIAITGRHTALGDTLATAELLLKLCERLEGRGLTTFGEVMKASNMAARLRTPGRWWRRAEGEAAGGSGSGAGSGSGPNWGKRAMVAAAEVDEVRGFLLDHPPFDAMEPAHLDALVERLRPIRFADGDAVTDPGAGPAEWFYILWRGRILGEEQREDERLSGNAWELLPGECFPVGALVEGRPVRNVQRADGEVVCLTADRATFQAMRDMSPPSTPMPATGSAASSSRPSARSRPRRCAISAATPRSTSRSATRSCARR